MGVSRAELFDKKATAPKTLSSSGVVFKVLGSSTRTNHPFLILPHGTTVEPL